MNFHPFMSALIIAVAVLIFGCCADCARDKDNKYVKVCRINASNQDCYEFRNAHFSQWNSMVTIQDGHNKFSFNKSGWSILVMDKEERKRR